MLLDIGTENFKTIKLGLLRENWDECDHDYCTVWGKTGNGTAEGEFVVQTFTAKLLIGASRISVAHSVHCHKSAEGDQRYRSILYLPWR